jgi:hypothetical protein
MKTKKIEELMNEGFRKCKVEDRPSLYKCYMINETPCVEVYEIDKGEWTQKYFGEFKYIGKYISIFEEGEK